MSIEERKMTVSCDRDGCDRRVDCPESYGDPKLPAGWITAHAYLHSKDDWEDFFGERDESSYKRYFCSFTHLIEELMEVDKRRHDEAAHRETVKRLDQGDPGENPGVMDSEEARSLFPSPGEVIEEEG